MSLGKCVLERKEHTKTSYMFSKVASFSLIFVLSCNCFYVASSVDTVGHHQENGGVYKADIPTDNQQEISIRIGAKQMETKESGMSLFADEGDGGTGNSTGGTGSTAESTTSDSCKFGLESNCCFQYTWGGYTSKIPEEAANATCDYLKKERRDDTIACFDPMVYTIAKGTPNGNPPNITELVREAETHTWGIYCVNSGKSCVSYTYYNTEKKPINQTKFCGVVTDNSDNRIDKGCYRQNVGGYVREVCVCKSNLCNSTTSILQSPLQSTWILVALLLAKIITNRILLQS